MIGVNSSHLMMNTACAKTSSRCRTFSLKQRPHFKVRFGMGFGFGSGQQPGVFRRDTPTSFAQWSDCVGKWTTRNEQRREVESVRIGYDDCGSPAEAKCPKHLVVMVNGIVGSAADWRYAAEQFVQRLPDKVVVHCSECNSSRLTFDGVDMMGERLAEEVMSIVKQNPGIEKISFVAHSLGGLVARYAVGRLYGRVSRREELVTQMNSGSSLQCFKEHKEGYVAGLEPFNFITFATPHLGSSGNKQLPFLCGLPFLEKSASQTAHWLVGRTGKHLFLTDMDDGKCPLLLRMVRDTDDIKFISALQSFKRCVAYANVDFDHIVGWRTSSIRRQQELPMKHLLVSNETYPHIVHMDKGKTENREVACHMDQVRSFEEEMIKGLNQVAWERVDVSFHKSKQRYVAHSTIQVKSYWINSDGRDVISHMMDNFLV